MAEFQHGSEMKALRATWVVAWHSVHGRGQCDVGPDFTPFVRAAVSSVNQRNALGIIKPEKLRLIDAAIIRVH